LGMQRIELYTQFDKPVAKQQLDTLHDLVKRAGGHEPIAYLTGKTEFYSLELNITPVCLIPRPETELLVDKAIEFLKNRPAAQLVCDLCTGSGCVAVAIAKNFDGADIIATDISQGPLDVAAANIKKYNLKTRVKLLCGDLFEPIAAHSAEKKFDLITCNPPYVTASEFEALDKNVKDYEPKSALLAGKDGLEVCRRIIQQANNFLKDDAALLLEVGHKQADNITALLHETGCFTEVRIEKDFQGIGRVAIARRMKSD
jgi:release factor glutamine methyltransferase